MILRETYKREQFVDFVTGLLPSLNIDEREIRTADTKSSNIESAHLLGETKELDLKVFEIKHTGTSKRRVGLTMEGFQMMRSSGAFRALIAFYSEDDDQWRFSLMTLTPKRNEKAKLTIERSSPKRYSFVLGPNSKTATPEKFLISKGAVSDFEDLQSRFSLEVVNKDFYKKISELFTKLVGGTAGNGKNKTEYEPLLKLPSTQDKSQTSLEFAVRLIGRVIFCWFLREKKSKDEISLMPSSLLSNEAVHTNENYYHSVLEPIFFEVLNKPIKERKPKYTENGFNSIPYLNGGLFTPHHDDFFHYNEGKQAISNNTVRVPDTWLQEFFEFLETYNFTIDENISFDEELSIDPEMLGRIFENLLAEINPETGESARKSTGSYYTPRTIVDYMVDESLYAYLDNKTSIYEEKIRAVISYDLGDDAEYPLNEEEQKNITEALHQIKILDPACGSGAFPMGMLQKIVFILQQTDPDGKNWFKKQIQHASPEIRRAIEREFENKNFDYIRKLGIIRENIFGVDIQPIATEISRLRCFLTLIVDESIDDSEENRGIEPLPNLDFKFVTANTLIGLPQSLKPEQQGNLFDDERGIEELQEVRDMFFNATGTEKIKLESEFRKIQNRMLTDLIQNHIRGHAELTSKLTTWDPFTHEPSSWFDPEWMFGIKDGFDVVIANPPYLKERDNKKVFEKVNNSEFGKKYHQGKMDFWYYFLHRAMDLVNENGVISYITSRYWLNSFGAKKLIKRVKENLCFLSIIDIGKLGVFNEVVGHHMVAVYKKNHDCGKFIYKQLINDLTGIQNTNTDKSAIIKKLSNKDIYSINNEIIFENCEFNSENIRELGKICDITQGVVQNPDRVSKKIAKKFNLQEGNGVFVLTDQEVENIKLNEEESNFIKPFYDSSSVSKYYFDTGNKKNLLYLTRSNCKDISKYPNLKNHLESYKVIMDKRRETKKGTIKWWQMHWPRKEVFFESKKIVLPSMFLLQPATYIEDSAYFGLSSNIIIAKNKEFNLRYILAILNSKFALNWFNKNGKKRGAGVDIGVEKLRLFPIKILSTDGQKPIINLVDEILTVTSNSNYSPDLPPQKQKEMEEQIDEMVYKLYDLTVEEIGIIENNIS